MSSFYGTSAWGEIPTCGNKGPVLAVASPFQGLVNDPSIPKSYALVIKPRSGATEDPKYASTDGYRSLAGDTPSQVLFPARLLTPYSYRVSLFGSGRLATGKPSLPGFGSVRVANLPVVPAGTAPTRTLPAVAGEYDDWFNLNWDDAELVVYLGESSRPPVTFSLFTPIFTGRADEVSGDSSSIDIHLKDLQSLTEQDLQERNYYGLANCLYFDGANSYAKVRAFVFGAIASPTLTTEAWVWPQQELSSGADTIWGKNLDWCVQQSGTLNRLRFIKWHTDGNRYIWTWNDVFDAANWDQPHHVAVVLDGGVGQDDITLYIDGVDQGQANAPSSAVEARNAGKQVAFGAFEDGTQKWKGMLDEVRLWKTARTQAEIRECMNRQLSLLDVTDDLLGAWSFDEAAPAHDAETFGIDAPRQTFINTTPGHALITHDAKLDPATLTIECWIYPKALGAVQGLLDKGGNSGWRLRLNSSDALQFFDRGSTNSLATATGLFSLQRWYHVAVVADSTGLYLYVDGVLQKSGGAAYGSPTTTDDLKIGRNLASEDFDGYIDDVRVWKVARTAAEISDSRLLHVSPLDEPDLVAYYRFDEQTGTTVGDSTSNGLDGTLNTAGWLSSIADIIGQDLGSGDEAYWVSMLEGDDEVASKPKPTCYGECRHVQPVLVDRFWNVYQVHDMREIKSLVAYDGALELTAVGDEPDVWSLYDDSLPAAGSYRTCLALGLVQLGSAPSKVLTCDVEGDVGSGYVDQGADLVDRIAKDRSRGRIDATNIDPVAVALTREAMPGVQGHYTRLQPLALGRAFDALLASRGWWSFDRTGKLVMGVIEEPTTKSPQVTFTEADLSYGKLKRRRRPKVSWREEVSYRASWYGFTETDINAALALKDRAPLVEGDLFTEAGDETIKGTGASPGAHPGAVSGRTTTLFVNRQDAQREADARFALFGTERQVYELSVEVGIFQYFLGDVANLVLQRFGLSGGRAMMVVGLDEKVRDKGLDLKVVVWG